MDRKPFLAELASFHWGARHHPCFQHRRTSLRNNFAYVEPASFRAVRSACMRNLTCSHTHAGNPNDPLNSIE
jgi:hypothetical protein